MARVRLALLAAIACASAALLTAAAPDVSVPKYDVRLEILPDGSLDVVERIDVAVGAAPLNAFERIVPGRRLDEVTNAAVTMDGQALPVAIAPGRDPKLSWAFSPVANSQHTFELRYRAVRVLARELEGPRLVWAAVPPTRNYSIESSTISVFAPTGAEASYVGAPGGAVLPSTAERPGLTIAGRSLAPGQTVTVDISFAPNSIRPAEARWFAKMSQQLEMVPAWLAGAACLVVVGAGILVMAFARLPRRSAALPPEQAHAALVERRRTYQWLVASGVVLIISGLAGLAGAWLLVERYGVAPLSIPLVMVVVGLVYVAIGKMRSV